MQSLFAFLKTYMVIRNKITTHVALEIKYIKIVVV